jgi:hypothetical protein
MSYKLLVNPVLPTAGKTVPAGMCLKNVRGCYGIASKFATAADAFRASTKIKYTNNSSLPKGTPIAWENGARLGDAGHIAIYAGGNKVFTSDSPKGKWGLRDVNELTKSWNMSAPYFLYSVNGVTVLKKTSTLAKFKKYKVKTLVNLNYRAKDSTSSKILGTFKNGKTLTITAVNATKTWGKTSKGWINISKKYVKKT